MIPESYLARMTRDLKRALAKPERERAWAMVIDTRKCTACKSCMVACIAENHLPRGVFYRRVFETEFGAYPEVTRIGMPTNCQQCDDPPCAKAAPKGAIRKRPDGIVEFDYSKLRGRKVFEAVQAACPFSAVSYDEGKYYTDGTPARQPYELAPNFDYGKPQTRDPKAPNSLTGAVRKCTFCLHRLNNGILPACVTTCFCRAVYFGDLNDPESLVSRLLAENEWFRLHKDAKPRVYYLKGKFVNKEAFESCAACHDGGEEK
jgi:tetrathionate reductase subunit B